MVDDELYGCTQIPHTRWQDCGTTVDILTLGLCIMLSVTTQLVAETYRFEPSVQYTCLLNDSYTCVYTRLQAKLPFATDTFCGGHFLSTAAGLTSFSKHICERTRGATIRGHFYNIRGAACKAMCTIQSNATLCWADSWPVTHRWSCHPKVGMSPVWSYFSFTKIGIEASNVTKY